MAEIDDLTNSQFSNTSRKGMASTHWPRHCNILGCWRTLWRRNKCQWSLYTCPNTHTFNLTSCPFTQCISCISVSMGVACACSQVAKIIGAGIWIGLKSLWCDSKDKYKLNFWVFTWTGLPAEGTHSALWSWRWPSALWRSLGRIQVQHRSRWAEPVRQTNRSGVNKEHSTWPTLKSDSDRNQVLENKA